ncbi:MAG: hypothetical protein ABS949_08230 [Solibacillus sp.]
MTKELPSTLLQRQEMLRNETKDKIQQAINTLKEEGAMVTKKALIELSGYSASTFSKPHIKELLEKNEVCQFRKTTQTSKSQNDQRNQKKIEALEKKCMRLEQENLNKDIRIAKLESDLEEEKEYGKKLLGKLHTIMRKAEMKGINIE